MTRYDRITNATTDGQQDARGWTAAPRRTGESLTARIEAAAQQGAQYRTYDERAAYRRAFRQVAAARWHAPIAA